MRKIYLSICLALNVLAFSQSSLSTSLTACYSLDGNANDPVSGLTGTLSAITPTVNRFSQPNTAIAFSGNITSFIRLPDNPLIKPTNVSFSGWVKTNVTNSHQYIVYINNGCTNYYEGYTLLYYNVGPNAYRFSIVKSTTPCSSSSQMVVYGSTTTITANSWYHVGFYIGSDSMKLYVNGALNGSIANSNPIVYGANKNVYLGSTNEMVNFPFNGSLDNVRFYNRKLSGTEFNQLYTLDPICQPQPIASFSVSATNFCINQTIALTSTSTNSPTTFAWTMAGGSPSVSAIASPVVSYPTAGVYTISLVASNAFGSSAPVTQTVNVSTCIGVSESLNDNTLTVYPIPTKTEIHIIGADKGSEIKIMNALGAVIYSVVATAENEKVNLAPFNHGLYFAKLIQNGKPITVKIIKE